MFSPNLVSHPQRHVTFFQAPRDWLASRHVVGGPRGSRGAIVGDRRGSKIASGKIYRALRRACFNAIFQVIFKTLDSTVALIVDSSV